MKTCIDLPGLAYPVRVTQHANKVFTVTYGLQVKTGLTYEQAAKEFGAAVFHALACDGKIADMETGKECVSPLWLRGGRLDNTVVTSGQYKGFTHSEVAALRGIRLQDVQAFLDHGRAVEISPQATP